MTAAGIAPPGRSLRCVIHGKVTVRGLTDAPIIWPFTWLNPNRMPTVLLCGDLIRAVRRESSKAIMHHWGVSLNTVWKWRKALGVEEKNEGTQALHSRWAPESCQSGLANKRRMPTLHSPERAAKIATAKRGKPRPRHVIEALRRANLGRKLTAEHCQKLSEANKRRGAYPPAAGRPFTSEEDVILGTATDREIGERLGRGLQTIHKRRQRLGVEAFRKR